MSLNSGAIGGETAHDDVPEIVARLLPAYLSTYRGPHGGAPGAEAAVTGPVSQPVVVSPAGPALVEAQYRLGSRRPAGETRVAVYGADEPGGFGPALQIVTDNATMLMDSVTVLLHRLGVAYTAIMNPVFRVRRGAEGELLDIVPSAEATFSGGVDETWVHVQLAGSVDRRAAWPPNSTSTPGAGSPARTARTSRRCCAGWPTGISCSWAISAVPFRVVRRRSTCPAGWACCDSARTCCLS
jgi:glutamate dehydrogenase